MAVGHDRLPSIWALARPHGQAASQRVFLERIPTRRPRGRLSPAGGDRDDCLRADRAVTVTLCGQGRPHSAGRFAQR
jgi:hypothetical protein